MTEAIKARQVPISSEDLQKIILDRLQDTKAKNIIQLDLRQIPEAASDFFIICEGESTTQVRSIAEHVRKDVKEEHHILPSHVEGAEHAKWILVDYFDVVIHVFHPEARSFYELEDLWSDAQVTLIEEK